MNYISNPSEDDFLLRICRNIPGSVYREYFKRNPDEFSILGLQKPLNTLTDKALLEQVAKHTDSPVVIRIIKAYIQESFIKNKKDSAREEKEKRAMEKVLNDFYSDRQRDPHARLSRQKGETSLSKEDRREKQDAETCANDVSEGEKESSQQEELSMEDTEDIRGNMIQESVHADEDTSVNDSLKQEREKSQQEEPSMEDTAGKRENMIQESDRADEREIPVKNSSRQGRERSQHEELSMEDVADKRENLIQKSDHADELKTLRGIINDYDYLSVCEIIKKDYKGNKRMFRMADIDRNGILQKFNEDEEDGINNCDNRKNLYYVNGPDEVGKVAVWGWRVVPNRNNPERDYIESEFRPDISPVELVILFKECSSETEILGRLKEGIHEEISTEQVLFVTQRGKKYSGLLCKKNQFVEMEPGIISLSEKVVRLPKYQFTSSDLVYLPNKKWYLNNIILKQPEGYVYAKSGQEVVREVLLSRSTWNMFKKAGKSKNEWKCFQEFLTDLDATSVVETISEKAECPLSKAQEMLNEFVAHAGEYMNGYSVEDQVLLAEIYSNEKLMNRCKELIKSDWEEENHKEIENRKKKLTDIEKNIENANTEYEKVRKQNEELQSENCSIQAKISENEQLATDVENQVKERIHKARENVAEFIAEMAFCSPQSIVTQSTLENPPAVQAQNVSPGANPGRSEYQSGVNLNAENLEPLEDWKQALDLIRVNLSDAGVANQYAEALAAYLYASFQNRIPILLVGPGSTEIADAFSLSLFGKKAGVLVCEEPYSQKIADDCLNSGDEVVRIVNPFHYNWVSRLPQLINHEEPFFFADCPYIEEVQAEPKSFYNYFLPVFTELFVDNAPESITMVGRRSDSFEEFQQKAGRYKFTASGLQMNSLIRNRFQRNLEFMHAMLKNQDQDYDVLFALVPYAEATMQMPTVLDALGEQGKLNVSQDLRKRLADLYGGLS